MPLYIPPISRRSFIKSTSVATAGYLLGFHRNLLGQTSNIDPNYFVLLADTHIDADRDRVYREVNMGENLTITVDRIINSYSSKPAGVILNGDAAITRGLSGDYATLMEILQPLRDEGIPVYITMGNHDDRGPFYETIPDMVPDVSYVSQRHILIVECPEAYMFLLDTLDQVNQAPGELGSEQLDWLDQALSDYNDKPVMIFGHHFPETGSGRGLQDIDEFYEIALAHRHVKIYFYGHSHRWQFSSHEGLHLVNHPATSYVFRPEQPSAFVHANFEPGRVHLKLDCLDIDHSWHEQQGYLNYRDDAATDAEQYGNEVDAIRLHQNYPNPFNPKTTIQFDMNEPGHVSLSVYNINGEHVANLVNETRSAGLHEVGFDAGRLASGNFIYRLTIGEKTLSKQMTVIK